MTAKRKNGANMHTHTLRKRARMQRKRRWTGKGTGTAVQKRLESKHVSPDDVNQFPG